MSPSPITPRASALARRIFLTLLAFVAAWVGAPGSFAWEPGISQPTATGSPELPLVVDVSDRNDVISFYHCIYQASSAALSHIGWTGSLADCNPGTTDPRFQRDVLRRINYFRAMAGVPADITFSDALNRQAQAAALIMAEHRNLAHNPAAAFGTGGCWSLDGQHAAESGNLNLGSIGPFAVESYMRDDGVHNAPVGHRRWILFPGATVMGTGDVPQVGTFPFSPTQHPSTNCLFVIDPESNRQETPSFVSWPPAGFVPSDQLYQRWSLQFHSLEFGYPRFTNAAVRMKLQNSGQEIPVRIDYRDKGGSVAGDPVLVWTPNRAGLGGAFPLEKTIEITVTGIDVGNSGASTEYRYTVTPIDPHIITDPLQLTGPTMLPAAGGTVSWTPLSGIGADSYEIEVSGREENASWMEGAEGEDLPQVIDGTSPSYDLQTPLASLFTSPGALSGSQAFHLTFPTLNEPLQTVIIDRPFIAGPGTRLTFHHLFRWSTTESRLAAEISVDGGSWIEVWGQNGNNATNTNAWITQWTREDIDLAGYAGSTLRLRFRYAADGFMFTGDGADMGIYLDDISVGPATLIHPGRLTSLPGTASAFTLDPASAGSPLEDGDAVVLRLRAVLGCRTFPFGPAFEVTIGEAAAPGFADWMAENFPDAVLSGFLDDPDGDRVPNGAEFAFGLHPERPDAVPAPFRDPDGSWHLQFHHAALSHDTSGILYGAEWSTDLRSWTSLNDTGPEGVARFSPPLAPTLFLRWTIRERSPGA